MTRTSTTEKSGKTTIGTILRSARAALKPQDVGLPARARSRTPGLRREDVAELADISESYYSWLEQGRIERPSERILRRIARALKLSEEDERRLIAQTSGLDPAAESYAIIAAERLAAFLDDYTKHFGSAFSLEQLALLWVEGIHHDHQLTYFITIEERVSTVVQCRGPFAEKLLNYTNRIDELGKHLPALLRGEPLAVPDLHKSENRLLRRLGDMFGEACFIEVALRVGGAPVAMIGYAEPQPRIHSALEQHLLKSIAAVLEYGLSLTFTSRLCDLRRSIAS